MSKLYRIAPRFVKQVPSPLEDGVVYVSIEFGTVIHKCCCGCGDKVVTPLTPVDWTLIYDGQSISLKPSIGRWDAPCRSHYWIQNNRVIWSAKWSSNKVDALKQYESELRDDYFALGHEHSCEAGADKSDQVPVSWGWFKRLFEQAIRDSKGKSSGD